MKPIPFNGQNHVFAAPKGWDEAKHGPCADLPTRIVGDEITSVWDPSPEERATIAAGGGVELTLIGRAMPPVALDARPLPPVLVDIERPSGPFAYGAEKDGRMVGAMIWQAYAQKKIVGQALADWAAAGFRIRTLATQKDYVAWLAQLKDAA